MADLQVDWEKLGKRMIAASQIGIRIEQFNGHRWLIEDPEADFCLRVLETPDDQEWYVQKEYGSYQAALDSVDEALAAKGLPSLMDRFEAINDTGSADLAIVFGEGTQ